MPDQQKAEEAGLNATKDNAFNDIVSGARQRGLGFSGIPLGEQAGYLSTNYLPAVANLKSAFQNRQSSLADTLNGIGLDENKYAQTIRQSELDRDEAIRQFNEKLAAEKEAAAAAARAAAGSGAYDLGGGAIGAADASAPAAESAGAKAFKQSNGTFAFRAPNGATVNAYQYAQITGTPIRNLLSWMAGQGDGGAKAALGFIGNDGNADPRKITNQSMANLYKALTGRNVGIYKAPAPKAAPKPVAKIKSMNIKKI